MAGFFRKTAKTLFGEHLDFRIWQFNILMATGILICIASIVTVIITGAPRVNILFYLLTLAIVSTLLWYSRISGKHQFCYMASIICVFLFIFPIIFINTGGYRGNMPLFFVMAVVFTAFMLEGKEKVVMMIVELVVYTLLCVYAFIHRDKILPYSEPRAVFGGITMGIIAVSISLGVTMSLQFNLYRQRQRELEEARRQTERYATQVEEYAKMKSKLFANMSHEMRTPLTIMSAYAQFAVEQIREAGVSKQTLADLSTISDEAKRLAEMADGTLTILMTASEAGESGGRKGSQVDIGDLAVRLVKLLEPILSRKGRSMTASVAGGAPVVITGNADALTQLLWNILQNAITHSNGDVELTVEAESGGVKMSIRDDGAGIDEEILPRIFERGVRGKNGGYGIGLSICRDIARYHGGEITIVSNPGAGTCVTVALTGLDGKSGT